jgi:sulfatase modifying factor 1
MNGITSKSISNIAWYNVNSKLQTQAARRKYPNKFGVYNIFGSVSECVQDSYNARYKTDEVDNPVNLELGFGKVVRGRVWGEQADKLYPHYREHRPPYYRSEKKSGLD